jgi:hypothetical protein
MEAVMGRCVIALATLLALACSGTDMGESATTDVDARGLADIPVKKDDDNSPPRLHKIGNKEVQVGEEISFILAADDDDGDQVTFSAYGDMPPGGKFYKPEGRFVWTPEATGGPYFVTFVVSDMKDFDSETVELRAVATKTQHPPHFETVGDQFLKINEIYELRLEATDEDGDMLNFKVVSGMPATATFDAQNALFRWTPLKADEGAQVRVTFTVTDGAASDELEVRLIVEGGALNNLPPEVAEIDSIEAESGKEVSFVVQATDPDEDPLTITVESELPAGAKFNQGTKKFTWTPGPSHVGKSVYVAFDISDGNYHVKLMVNILVKQKSVGCGDDDFEPNNTPDQATQITEGTFANLSICDSEVSPIDQDWFKLLLEKDEQIEATITSDHSLGNLDLPLYAGSDFDSPAFYSPVDGDIEKITYTAPAAGTYYLRVVGTESWKYQVPYSLVVKRLAQAGCTPDDKEPNQSTGSATSLAGYLDGTPLSGLSICAGDIDYYKLPLTTGDSVIATIEFKDDEGDLDLRLEDSSGQTVDQSNGASDIETVVLDGAGGGNYYLVVEGYPKDATENTYSLELLVESSTDCTPDGMEPNNDKGGAKPMYNSGKFPALTLCGDGDWFDLGPGPGEVTVSVNLVGEGSAKAFFAEEFEIGNQTQLQCDSDSCLGVRTLPDTGNLYLIVEGAYGSTYDVEVLFESGSSEGSCVGICNGDGGGCWCDEGCVQYGDCCPDACTVCGHCESA